jgi:hypothetical protein
VEVNVFETKVLVDKAASPKVSYGLLDAIIKDGWPELPVTVKVHLPVWGVELDGKLTVYVHP